MSPIPKTITVIIDSREQIPLLFPENILYYPDRSPDSRQIRIKTKVSKVDAGDYCLQPWYKVLDKHPCLIERKGANTELHQNLLTKDYKRFTAALDRLVSYCRHPYLLLDVAIADFWTIKEHCPNPERVWDCLIREVSSRGINLLWGCNAKHATSRRILGEQCLRILLSHALETSNGQ